MKGETLIFSPGQVIFREGDDSSGVFLVKDGKVEIFRERDGTQVVLGQSTAGDVLGTVTLFSREPRTASARAMTSLTLLHISGEAVDLSMKSVPIWVQACLKDAIARLKYVDEKLVEAKLAEKKLVGRVGTSFHHGASLSSLIGSLMKTGIVKEDDIELFPMKGVIARAELVLLKRAEYLERIFQCFCQSGLVKVGDDKKFGPVIARPRAQLLDDFGVFCLQTAKTEMNQFAPTKLYPWMSALVRLQKKVPGKEQFSKIELAQLISKEMARTVSEALVGELIAHNVCRSVGAGNVTFNAQQVNRRIVFENTCRFLKDVKED